MTYFSLSIVQVNLLLVWNTWLMCSFFPTLLLIYNNTEQKSLFWFNFPPCATWIYLAKSLLGTQLYLSSERGTASCSQLLAFILPKHVSITAPLGSQQYALNLPKTRPFLLPTLYCGFQSVDDALWSSVSTACTEALSLGKRLSEWVNGIV